jgi:hypothetical protein
VRELLCDIRREHPHVSVTLILRTLRADGRVGPEVTDTTVRRMFAEKVLLGCAVVDGKSTVGRTRLKWQAGGPAHSGTATSATDPQTARRRQDRTPRGQR